MAETLNLEVKSNIKSVTKASDELGTSLGKSVDEAKDLGSGLEDAGRKGKTGLGKIAGGFKGIMKAVGVIALLSAAFEVFKEVLGKNQKVIDFFSVAMNVLSIAFNDLFKFLEKNVGSVVGWFKEIFEDPKQSLIDFGDAIKENLIERFMSLLDVFGFLGKALKELMAGELGNALAAVKEAGVEMADVFTGVDDSVDKLGKTFTEGAKAAKEYALATVGQATMLKDAEKAAARAAVEFAKLNAQYLKEAEDQRQIRDNVNLTFKERIEANEKLDKVLEKQQKLQKASVKTQVDYLQAQYDINASEENFIELGNAQVEMLSLQEAINGQLSEQKTNQIGLENELKEAKIQTFLEGISGTKRELAELEAAYKLKLDMARKAGEGSVEITKQYEIERQAIIDEAEKASLMMIKNTEALDREASKLKLERIEGESDAELTIRIEAAQKLADFKDDLAKKAFQALGSHLDASMNELEGNYSKEKRLAEANGEDTLAIDEKYEKERKKIANQQKAFKVAEALITTYQMASLAYKDGLEAGGPYGLVLGPIAAGVALAAGLANVRSILSQDVGAGGGGGAPGATSETPAPQMMSGAFELSGGEEVEPARAYVVSDDITDSQNALAIIRRRATI